jgi:ABC-type sugar transport system ATPase subunit
MLTLQVICGWAKQVQARSVSSQRPKVDTRNSQLKARRFLPTFANMTLLNVSAITKKQGDGRVLDDINFTLQRFQKLAVIGESGAGKSSLLKTIAGLMQPDSGEVLFDNKRVEGPLEKLIPGHPSIAYLSQHFELRNNYRVEEILQYANSLTAKEAATLFTVCRIEHLLKRRTDQLSGGEKQRVATARLLISSPTLLLLDEPFSNLDRIHEHILKSVIHDIGEKLKITCILITHDPHDVLTWADEVMVMKEGRIIQQGKPGDVYHRPVNEYAGALLGSYNLIPPGAADIFHTLPGVEQNDKTLFIRPEHIRIVDNKTPSVKGTIKKIVFAGAVYEMEVALTGITIMLVSMNAQWKEGDTIYIVPDTMRLWYL